MINRFHLFSIAFFWFGYAYGQDDIHFETVCQEISNDEIICDLFTLEGQVLTMSPENINPAGTNLLCPDGGNMHNTNFIAFEAPVGNYTLEITFSNCTGGAFEEFQYPQIVLYEEGCTIENAVFCDLSGLERTVKINSSHMQQGKLYYLLADGFAGSVCDVKFEIKGGLLNDNCEAVEYITMSEVSDWEYQLNTDGEIFYQWIIAFGDTIINNLKYRIIYDSMETLPTKTYYLRESELEKKIFLFDQSHNSDRILYDFNLTIGDSLLVEDGVYASVSTIDSVYSNYGFLKRWHFHSENDTFSYIECIGGSHLIHFSKKNKFDSSCELLQAYNMCYKIYGIDDGKKPLRWNSILEKIEREVCKNEGIQVNGRNVNTTGIYIDSFKNRLYCDSLIEIDLTVYENPSDTTYAEICYGEIFEYKNNTYSFTGHYRFYVETEEFCDSLYVLNLIRHGFNLIEIDICSGDEIEIQGILFDENNSTGNIVLPGSATNGCDSVIGVRLDILPIFYLDTIIEKCKKNTIVFQDSLISNEGVYEFTFSSVDNCDSLISLTVIDLVDDPNCVTNAIILGELKNEPTIYPNPLRDNLTIISFEFPIRYSIYNMKGEQMISGQTTGTNSELDLSHLSTGMYFLKFTYKNKISLKRIIKI